MTAKKNPAPGGTGNGAESQKQLDYSSDISARFQRLLAKLHPVLWPQLAVALALALTAAGGL